MSKGTEVLRRDVQNAADIVARTRPGTAARKAAVAALDRAIAAYDSRGGAS